MKTLPYALFDMDGTLVDSMTHWMRAPLSYARAVLPNLTEEMARRVYLTHDYADIRDLLASWGAEVSVPALIRASEDAMVEEYLHHIDAKAGVPALLASLHHAGTKMGIITMTPHHEVEICLARTGLDRYFSFVLTTEDTSDGSGKEKPEIFGIALEKLGCKSPAECMFFEDSLYAARTAHDMGFYLVGVYDRWAESDKVRALSDAFLNLDGDDTEV